MQAAEFKDKMKRFFKIITGIMALLLIGSMLCACGSVTDQDPNVWPKKGPASSVPKPESGELVQALTKEDVDGNAFSIIQYKNFDAAAMGNYIRLLIDKKYETVISQQVVENFILYSAEKNDIRVSLRLNTDDNTLRIEVEKNLF